VKDSFLSDGLRLAAHLARPPAGSGGASGLVVCHGFPSGPRGAATSAATYPELADRLARDAGWLVLAFNFRGTGTSEGDFSPRGWLDDLSAAVGALAEWGAAAVWVAGFGEGGAVALCAADRDDRVRGVAALGAPIALDQRRDPERHLDALSAARRLPPRPLLVVHGTDDDRIPASDARALCDAAGPSAELRIVHAAGSRLRHDPRVIALLLGWLERQQP
jgi:alpha/beta superfamily hydrolase